MHRLSIYLLILLGFGCETKLLEPLKEIEIKGIYGHPKPLWDKGLRLDELGVNAVFVHSQSLSPTMISRARVEGAKVFAEFATLNGKNYVDKHPEAWPIDVSGNKVEAASWFMGVCPTDPGFLQHRLSQLEQLLKTFTLDGVWMDYLHWHAQFEEPEPILPETCFCRRCMDTFATKAPVDLPNSDIPAVAQWILKNREAEWREWRCQVIIDWTRAIREVIDKTQPSAILGLYHCPWNDTEFDGAQRTILGLDYSLLRDHVDVFSPMVYHQRMGREPAWVDENITWLSQRLEIKKDSFPKLWPIVQAHNDPDTISANEFEQVLIFGLSAAATGVQMFTTRSIAEDSTKLTVVKNIYAGIR